jgi:hypothetical protein
MDYTEVPTSVLVLAYDLVINTIQDKVDHPTKAEAKTGKVAVKFNLSDIDHLEPLVKWLEYVAATWAEKDRQANPWHPREDVYF